LYWYTCGRRARHSSSQFTPLALASAGSGGFCVRKNWRALLDESVPNVFTVVGLLAVENSPL